MTEEIELAEVFFLFVYGTMYFLYTYIPTFWRNLLHLLSGYFIYKSTWHHMPEDWNLH